MARSAMRTPRPQAQPYKPRSIPKLPPQPERVALFSLNSIGRLFGGAVGGLIVVYVGLVYRQGRAERLRVEDLDIPADTSDRYNRTANRFDADIDTIERTIGINRRRQELCAKARGHVLETSVGTGRNMKYFPLMHGVKSVTMVDKSREMIEVARLKWPEEGNAWFINAAFRVQDASERVPCPSKNGFDTVVQTMGLCSTGEPEKLLRNLGAMTNPDGGRILLLEHGLGRWSLVNWWLNRSAKAHADRHGCWHNKDIGAIVERSGLEVVEAKRFNFGTTWWFELKPPPRPEPVVQLDVPAVTGPASNRWSIWDATPTWLR